jgi:ParB family chromosome partitioning protein
MFKDVVSGIKTFEYRKNDRDYKVNDILELCEWDPATNDFTDDRFYVVVTYIIKGGSFGIPEDYCIMSIVPEDEDLE